MRSQYTHVSAQLSAGGTSLGGPPQGGVCAIKMQHSLHIKKALRVNFFSMYLVFLDVTQMNLFLRSIMLLIHHQAQSLSNYGINIFFMGQNDTGCGTNH